MHDLFDIVCGTSTGGILAALFAVKRTPVQEAGRLYDELIKKVFSKVCMGWLVGWLVGG